MRHLTAYRSGRIASVVGTLAAFAGMGLSFTSTVKANLVVTVSETGLAPQQLINVAGMPSSDLSGVDSVTYGDFKINITASEADQTTAPSVAELLSSSLKIQNISSPSATHTLNITISATGYTSPTTPPPLTFTSEIGGTVIAGSVANALTFQGYVDPSNTPTTVGAFTPGPQPVIPVTLTGNSFDSTAPTLIASLGSPYAMLGTIGLTLGGGAAINYSSSETLTVVPEPASIGLLALASAGLLRRRQRA